MSSLNRITLIGRLGKDPELRHTQGGKPFCTFSLATDESWTDGSGQKQERTEWHSVAVFTKAAEACHKYLKKGSLAYVEGKLQSREYEKNGVKHRAWDVSAFDVKFLSYAKQDDGASAGYAATDATFPAGDDDLPTF